MLRKAGFINTELFAETGFNSSPKTKGVLIRADKPKLDGHQKGNGRMEIPLNKYQEFFDAVYAEGRIDRKTKHLIALGASLAAGCDQ